MATVQKLMQVLGVSEEEAREILATDKAIERGADPFPLTDAEEKASKEARRAEQDKATRKQTAKPKKLDTNKRAIINRFIATLENWFISNSQCTYNACTNIETVNPEREFTFIYNGIKYKVVLSAPRS